MNRRVQSETTSILVRQLTSLLDMKENSLRSVRIHDENDEVAIKLEYQLDKEK
jgi:hypothetical protein